MRRHGPGCAAALALLVAAHAAGCGDEEERLRLLRENERLLREIKQLQRERDRLRRSLTESSRTIARLRARAALPATGAGSPGGTAIDGAPHPDFPTPDLARTEKIFLLEEPDRGPVVTSASIPEEKALRWTTHSSCALHHGGLACGAEVEAGKMKAHFRVGRQAGAPVAVQEVFGPRTSTRPASSTAAGC